MDMPKQETDLDTKPTGEWTADKIPACLQSITAHDWGLIADAHNAAVKEAYQKGKRDGIREHYVGK